MEFGIFSGFYGLRGGKEVGWMMMMMMMMIIYNLFRLGYELTRVRVDQNGYELTWVCVDSGTS